MGLKKLIRLRWECAGPASVQELKSWALDPSPPSHVEARPKEEVSLIGLTSFTGLLGEGRDQQSDLLEDEGAAHTCRTSSPARSLGLSR